MKSGGSLRCAGAYVSLLAPVKNRLYRLPPKKDYHVYITRSIYRYAYARQAQVNWKKETKKRKEDEGKERKEKKAKKIRKNVYHAWFYGFFVGRLALL